MESARLGSIIWVIKPVIKPLRGFLWGTNYRVFLVYQAHANIGKVEDRNACVQQRLERYRRVRLHT